MPIIVDYGKWSQPGVPHRGWTCVGIEDLGEPSATCEMCERQTIRYVHMMTHPEYPDTLGCGCDCAGKMEEDYEGARRREQEAKNRAERRARFPSLQGWRVSAKGNPYITKDGVLVTVVKRRGGYGLGARWIYDPGAQMHWGGKVYATVDEAKRAAFDAVEHVLKLVVSGALLA